MVFPGKAIMLREHFRCVEPIIRFSSRFYPKPLIPLRVPKATERLDPPLIDIYIPHGRKINDVNEAEADVIVGEIGKLVADSGFRNRSIGVISLIGEKQAKLIYDRLIRVLGAETVEHHRIMCGNAASFQGQERDVIFLSMVACPETAVAQTSRIFKQRFNVAMSRARDRLVLVRSVAASHLKPDDLKLSIIEHFRHPMEDGNIAQAKDILDLCDSMFERDFGKRLLNLGYRIRPQVPVGDRRIDFVVEGHQDRRLAIELDGDKYHGPERWANDMRRQKSLERLGWTFWRCWGSNWIADPEGCLNDLKVVLDRLGIEPIGAAPFNTVYTQHIQIPAPNEYDVDKPSDELDKSNSSPDKATPTTMHQSNGAVSQTISAPVRHAMPKEQLPLLNLKPTQKRLPGLSVQKNPPQQSQTARPAEPEPENLTVEVGDLVVIRYDDTPDRPLRIRLSTNESRPLEGVVNVEAPLGAAVLGASVEEEVEIRVDGRSRTAHIERVEKCLHSQ